MAFSERNEAIQCTPEYLFDNRNYARAVKIEATTRINRIVKTIVLDKE